MASKERRNSQKIEPDTSPLSVNERILKNIHDIYTTSDMPLKMIAEELSAQINVPRKRITIMLIGNHSAGKSSFINWYIGETIQRTGVAIETSGFTIITSGKKRETWKGEATLTYYEHLVGLKQFHGLLPCLETEICTSKERSFSLVDFIDTPGLTDGQLQYPYDVQECIEYFANHSDMILVFFDPIGQALCARTMNVVQRLNAISPEKCKYFLSKADTVPVESDRQKVLIQITQNLSSRIKNQHAFDLPTIYIPTEKANVSNAISQLCKDIDKIVTLSVQSALNNLEAHCTLLSNRMRDLLDRDRQIHLRNDKARRLAILYLLLGSLFLFPPFAYILSLLKNGAERYGLATSLHSSDFADNWPRFFLYASDFFTLVDKFVDATSDNDLYVLTASLALYCLALLLAQVTWKREPTYEHNHKKRFQEIQTHLKLVMKQKKDLYEEYFKQSVIEDRA